MEGKQPEGGGGSTEKDDAFKIVDNKRNNNKLDANLSSTPSKKNNNLNRYEIFQQM